MASAHGFEWTSEEEKKNMQTLGHTKLWIEFHILPGASKKNANTKHIAHEWQKKNDKEKKYLIKPIGMSYGGRFLCYSSVTIENCNFSWIIRKKWTPKFALNLNVNQMVDYVSHCHSCQLKRKKVFGSISSWLIRFDYELRQINQLIKLPLLSLSVSPSND